MLQNYHTEFLTGTIFSWHHLLKDDEFKKVITDSFQWLTKEKKCIINAFVIVLYDGQCNLKGGESIVQKFQNFVGRQKSPKDIINDVAQRFEEVKPMLDKYPKSFSLIWSEENGYCLSVDLDCLERLPVSADLSL